MRSGQQRCREPGFNRFGRDAEEGLGVLAGYPEPGQEHEPERGDGVGWWWTGHGTRQPGKVCRLLGSGGAAIRIRLLGDISVQVDDDHVKQFKRRVLS